MICGRIMIGVSLSNKKWRLNDTNFTCFLFTFQNIIMYEYLPTLLGQKLPIYMGYKPDLHPGISHIFQSAAFRFGHTLIPPGIYRRDAKCNYKVTQTGRPAVRLCGTWWDSTVSNFSVISSFTRFTFVYFRHFLHVLCSARILLKLNYIKIKLKLQLKLKLN